MKKLAVMTGLVAFASAVFADPSAWFDAKISEYDPNEWPDLAIVTPENGMWQNAEVATYSDQALRLQNSDDPLVFVADVAKALDSTVPTMTSSILFTAYDEDDKPEIPADAKGGLIVCEDAQGNLSYWGVAKVGEANAWVKLDGTPDLDAAVNVAMTVSGSTVTYRIGADAEQAKEILIPGETPAVSKVSFQGVGTVAALAGSYVDALKTLTIDVVALAAQNLQVSVSGATQSGEGIYTFASGADITLTFAPVDGAYMLGSVKTKTYAAQTADFAVNTRPDGVSKAFTASETDPLEISSYDEFVAFKDLVNAGDSFEGKFLLQTTTIDFAGKDPWVGIGGDAAAASLCVFKGTYDGDDYQLANVTFAKIKYNGIFQYFGGTLKDLVVDMVGFDSASEASSYGAAIVGNTRSGATFNHVITTGALSATHNVAGFAVQGHVGTYIGCTNRCEISSASRDRVAGFVSFAQTGEGNTSTFTDCANEANITGGETSGNYGVTAFIALLSNGHRATFVNCVNTGTLSCSNPSGFVGVFVGQLGGSGDSGSCSLELVDCPCPTTGTQKPIGHIVHSATGTETFNGYFAKTVDEVLTYCATPVTKGTFKVVMPNAEAIVLADVVAGDRLTLENHAVYSGNVSCEDTAFKVETLEDGVWQVVANPVGTTFTITSTGCSFKIDGAGEAVTRAEVTKEIEGVIALTLVIDGATVKLPVRMVSVAGADTEHFSKNDYRYVVTGTESPATIEITVADASTSDDVQPSDLVPADTDPENVEAAAFVLSGLATKGGKADTAVMKKIASWISGKSIAGDAIATTTLDLEAAYLLNVALDSKAIEDAKAAFKFAEIVPGTKPTIADRGYNGTISYLGSDNLADWSEATAENKFFKAELVK